MKREDNHLKVHTSTDEILKYVRAMRTSRNMSQERVAEFVGISRPFYTQLEGGKRRMRVDYILKIAAALGVPVSELFKNQNSETAAGRAG